MDIIPTIPYPDRPNYQSYAIMDVPDDHLDQIYFALRHYNDAIRKNIKKAEKGKGKYKSISDLGIQEDLVFLYDIMSKNTSTLLELATAARRRGITLPTR